jgi:hypothetical protein
VLARDRAGVSIVVHEIGADGGALRAVGIDGRHLGPIEVPPGQRLVGRTSSSGIAAPAESGWIVLSPDGSMPIDGSASALARHIGDGRAVALDEVTR